MPPGLSRSLSRSMTPDTVIWPPNFQRTSGGSFSDGRTEFVSTICICSALLPLLICSPGKENRKSEIECHDGDKKNTELPLYGIFRSTKKTACRPSMAALGLLAPAKRKKMNPHTACLRKVLITQILANDGDGDSLRRP